MRSKMPATNRLPAPGSWPSCAGRGLPSHVRAVFGDVSLASILSVGASAGISRQAILDAYRVARDNVAAANPELDAALKQDW